MGTITGPSEGFSRLKRLRSTLTQGKARTILIIVTILLVLLLILTHTTPPVQIQPENLPVKSSGWHLPGSSPVVSPARQPAQTVPALRAHPVGEHLLSSHSKMCQQRVSLFTYRASLGRRDWQSNERQALC